MEVAAAAVERGRGQRKKEAAARGTPSPTPPRSSSAGSKSMAVRVQMLDDSITLFQVQSKAPGRVLFDQVCKQLNLLEVDYFGLEYQDGSRVTVSVAHAHRHRHVCRYA